MSSRRSAIVFEHVRPCFSHRLEELEERLEGDFLVDSLVLHLLVLVLLVCLADFLEDELHDLDFVGEGQVLVPQPDQHRQKANDGR